MNKLSSKELKEKSFFDSVASKYDKNYGYDKFFTKYKIEKKINYFHRLIKNLTAGFPELKILEIGCGTGEYTKRLAKLFPKANIIGLDISKEVIQIAQKKCKAFPNVTFKIRSFYSSKLKKDYCDVICGFYSLHHMDEEKVLREAYRLLKPRGLLYFCEPNILNPIVYLIKSNKYLKKRIGDSPDEWAINPLTFAENQKLFKILKISLSEFVLPSKILSDSVLRRIDKATKFFGKTPFLKYFGGSVEILLQKNDRLLEYGPCLQKIAMLKKILIILIVTVVYLLYARFVLTPQIYKNFSLIDDGQSIEYGNYFQKCITGRGCNDFKTQVINREGARSRFGYWFIQGILYGNRNYNAQVQHEFRIYVVGLMLVLLLSGTLIMYEVHPVVMFISTAIFFTNYSFSENFIRLGPVEPYQAIFLGIFSILWFSRLKLFQKYRTAHNLLIMWVLIFFLLLKETSIAVMPSIIVSLFLFKKDINKKLLAIVVLIPIIVFMTIKQLLRGGGIDAIYVSEYSFGLSAILINGKKFITLLLNSTAPFIKIAIIFLLIMFIVNKLRKTLFTSEYIYWLLMFLSFTFVLFPWKYILDRYLLISIYAFSVFFALVLSKLIYFLNNFFVKKLQIVRYLFKPFVFIIMILLFFKGGSLNLARTINYRNWFSTFTQFEADQVKAIAESVHMGTMYINAKDVMENWEIVYEIPLHLKYFYGGKPKTERLIESLPLEGLLFSRKSLEPVINFEKLSKRTYPIISSKSYYVTQIDPIAFRQLFKLRPVQTFNNPPLLNEGFSYYWEIRKL